MDVSVFDMFKIGIGPSSSHTVGPMWAAAHFLNHLRGVDTGYRNTQRVQIDLYGSLALTGKGHGTDGAVLLGLSGETPDQVDPDVAVKLVAEVRVSKSLRLAREKEIAFDEPRDLIFHNDTFLPQHPNGVTFSAFDAAGNVILKRTFFSVGGGFVVEEGQSGTSAATTAPATSLPYPFASAQELIAHTVKHGLSIAECIRANEQVKQSDDVINQKLDRIWSVMKGCIERGCREDGILPGGLHVKRRAPSLFRLLQKQSATVDPLTVLDWVSLFALAVNEENAAGGRVVTAPTNGAAGVIPAVIAYYEKFDASASPEGIRNFLLTAGAIGMLYKRNASLSAAEMGCQGEVGVACSMAAAGLCAVQGGSVQQVENAAEIGMEHNLGLTCDPVGGLVQIPCIERNTMGATKAINAARLALHGDGQHCISLDRVIETMRQTGIDMQSKYKETSLGGLAIAVNITEC